MRTWVGLPRKAIARRAAGTKRDLRPKPGRIAMDMHRMRQAARCTETVISSRKARISRSVCVKGCFHFLYRSVRVVLCTDYPERDGVVRP